MTTETRAAASDLPAPALLVALVAASSAAALMLEIVAARLVAPYIGVSLHTWTAIIAVVLAGLSLGAVLGGRLADGPLARGRSRLVAALGLAALFTLLTPVLLRRTAALTGAGALPPTLEVLVLATAMLLVPSVFAGVVAPLATRLALAQTAVAGTGRLLGWIFAAGSAGSIVGTLLAGFVLIGYLGSLASVVLIAALYAAAALTVVAPGRTPWRALGLLVAGAGIVYAAGQGVGAWRSPCFAESAYSCIRLDNLGAEVGAPSRMLVIDHLPHGVNVLGDPDHFVMGHLELADRLARHRFGGVPPQSLFLGGGAYTLPRAWLAAGGDVVVAELDPLVTDVAEAHLWLRPSPDLAVHHGDARVVMATLPAEARFEVVFGDAFQDVMVPPHLVTREFAARVQARLTPGGLYMINVIDRPAEPRFVAALAVTLRRVFADVAVWRERRDGEPSGRRANYLVVATDRPMGVEEVAGGERYGRRWTTVRLPDDALVLTDDHSPVERLVGAHRREPASRRRRPSGRRLSKSSARTAHPGPGVARLVSRHSRGAA